MFPFLSILILIMLFSACYVAGRLLATHQPVNRVVPELWSPLSCLSAGMGLYMLWWLALMPVLGAAIQVTFGLFVICVLVLSAGMFRVWQRHNIEHHNGMMLLIMLIICWPLIILLGKLGLQGQMAYTAAQAIYQLPRFQGWPDAVQYTTYAFPSLESLAPGWLALWLPVQLAVEWLGISVPLPGIDGPWAGLMGLVNGAMLLLLASQLLVLLGIPVRWSNLLLCAAGGVLALLVLIPAGLFSVLTSLDSRLMAMVCFTGAITPLLRPTRLPDGVAALMPALGLVCVAVLHPVGLMLSLLVALLWAIRAGISGFNSLLTFARYVFAVTVLVCLPVMAVLLWHYVLGSLGQAPSAFWNQPWQSLNQLIQQLPHVSLAWLLWPASSLLVALRQVDIVRKAIPLVSPLPIIKQKVQPLSPLPLPDGPVSSAPYPFAIPAHVAQQEEKNPPAIPSSRLDETAAYIVPALFAGLVLIVALVPSWQGLATNVAQLLLPVWMVPLWFIAFRFYQTSHLQARAYQHPWAVGGILSAVSLAVGLMLMPLLSTPTPAVQQQLENIGQQIRQQQVVDFASPIATAGFTEDETAALAFALAHYAPVKSLALPEDSPTSRAQLYAQLRQQGMAYVLVNGEYSQTESWLGTSSPVVGQLLFRVDDKALTLVQAWGYRAVADVSSQQGLPIE